MEAIKNRLQLNREQLKLIAIASMIIDHLAWGFVEFYSPLGQFLHVLGRLTIPIMCFFIAEGFRKTSNLRNYINRILCFGILAVVPFYIFFHEEYGYRTNFIFDLLFGLLALSVTESTLKKWQKWVLMILIFGLSAGIGGWPITPTLFILIFYYGKSFKQKATLFIAADVLTVLFLVIAISLNSIYHFSHYEWVWWDKFYQLGFILALPLLYCYNGEKGKLFLGRYFFYIFYPAHFLGLAFIKWLFVEHIGAYDLDLIVHILVLAITCGLIFLAMRCRPSRGQVAVVFFLTSASVYIFGFILEIFSSTPDNYHLAVLVEYFGEVFTFIGLLYFVNILCKRSIPLWIYVLQVLISAIIIYCMLNTMETGLFYKTIGVDVSGPFPRLVLEYGIGFFLTITYIGILSVYSVGMAIWAYRKGSPLEKRRLKLFMWGIFFVWAPYPAKLVGLTGGYEIPGVGIAIASICFYMILIRYGFLDSVTLASESALDHGVDGIVVLGTDYMIQYHNKQLDDIFGDIPHDMDLRKHEEFTDILSGKVALLKKNNRIYEFNVEKLMDGTYQQGYMIWIHDSTEHYETMRQIREMATRDPLTKLYNRVRYQEKITTHLQAGRKGTFLMIDMDNFKQVNDKYGHQVGDEVLIAVADVFNTYEKSVLMGSRLGGDEFSAFLYDEIQDSKLNELITGIMTGYQERLSQLGYTGYTSLSIGAVKCDIEKPNQTDFATIYNMTDKVLYEVKKRGKNQYLLRSMESLGRG